jgi:hypothetical protein
MMGLHQWPKPPLYSITEGIPLVTSLCYSVPSVFFLKANSAPFSRKQERGRGRERLRVRACRVRDL